MTQSIQRARRPLSAASRLLLALVLAVGLMPALALPAGQAYAETPTSNAVYAVAIDTTSPENTIVTFRVDLAQDTVACGFSAQLGGEAAISLAGTTFPYDEGVTSDGQVNFGGNADYSTAIPAGSYTVDLAFPKTDSSDVTYPDADDWSWLQVDFDGEDIRAFDSLLGSAGGDSATVVEAWEIGSPTEGDVLAKLFDDGTLAFELAEGVENSGTKTFGHFNDQPWKNVRSDIESVEFAEGVAPTNMTFYFYGLENLEQCQDIPSGVTNMMETFENCSSLKKAPAIPAGVTNLMQTFNGCTSLEEVGELPVSVVYMGGCIPGLHEPVRSACLPDFRSADPKCLLWMHVPEGGA